MVGARLALSLLLVLAHMLGSYIVLATSHDEMIIDVGVSECSDQLCLVYVNMSGVFVEKGDVYVLETRYAPPVFKGLDSIVDDITGSSWVYLEDRHENGTYTRVVIHNNTHQKTWLSPTAPVSDKLIGLPGIDAVDNVKLYRDGIIAISVIGDPDHVKGKLSIEEVIKAVREAVREIDISMDKDINKVIIEVVPVEYDIAKDDAYTLYELYKNGKLDGYNVTAIGYDSDIGMPFIAVLLTPNSKLDNLIRLIEDNTQGPVALIIGEEPAPAEPVILERHDYNTLIAIIVLVAVIPPVVYVVRKLVAGR